MASMSASVGFGVRHNRVWQTNHPPRRARLPPAEARRAVVSLCSPTSWARKARHRRPPQTAADFCAGDHRFSLFNPFLVFVRSKWPQSWMRLHCRNPPVELPRFSGRFSAWVTSGYPQAARGAPGTLPSAQSSSRSMLESNSGRFPPLASACATRWLTGHEAPSVKVYMAALSLVAARRIKTR